jgi:hypothetical protein
VEQTWMCLNLILYPLSTNSITFCNRRVFGYVSLGGCQSKSSQTDRQTDTGSKVILFYISNNSQWFLERVENVNIKHYIKHSSPWQWYGYYFDSANFLANFICRSLSMFKYDKYIINSLIIIKYINKTYQHKNKCLLLTARFPKGR